MKSSEISLQKGCWGFPENKPMLFKLTETQELIRQSFADLLADKCSPKNLRPAWESGQSIEGLWKAMADMGALGVQAPESYDGIGGTEVETLMLMEQAGYYALPEPFLEHSGVAIPTLMQATQTDLQPGGDSESAASQKVQERLRAAIKGEIYITVKYEKSPFLSSGETADLFLILEEVMNEEAKNQNGMVYLLDKSEVDLQPEKSIDASRNLCRINYEASADSQLNSADSELAFDRGALASAGQCLGIAQRLLDMAIEYVKERKQFGSPVGSQQAVKHHLADVIIAIEHARPSAYAAAWDIANTSPEQASERAIAVSSAKALAGDAANLAARKTLQCFGAIGYTVESDLNFWLKKAWVCASGWGSSKYHYDRVYKKLSAA